MAFILSTLCGSKSGKINENKSTGLAKAICMVPRVVFLCLYFANFSTRAEDRVKKIHVKFIPKLSIRI